MFSVQRMSMLIIYKFYGICVGRFVIKDPLNGFALAAQRRDACSSVHVSPTITVICVLYSIHVKSLICYSICVGQLATKGKLEESLC